MHGLPAVRSQREVHAGQHNHTPLCTCPGTAGAQTDGMQAQLLHVVWAWSAVCVLEVWMWKCGCGRMCVHMRVCASHMGLYVMQAQLGNRDDKAHQGPSKQQHGTFRWQPDSAVTASGCSRNSVTQRPGLSFCGLFVRLVGGFWPLCCLAYQPTNCICVPVLCNCWMHVMPSE